MKKYLCALALLSGAVAAQAQTNSIDISSAQQTNAASGKWKVMAMSADMQTALCYGNTTGPAGPQSGASPVAPAAIGQDAFVLTQNISSWTSGGGTFLSCFPYNTLYTVQPAVKNNTNCTMTIERQFYVCSSDSEQVNINLSVICDDYLASASLDGNTIFTNTSVSPSFPNAILVNTSKKLAPGTHHIQLVCANNEDPYPNYFYAGGSYRQWNPFGVKLTGTVTTANSVLYNTSQVAMPAITGDTVICTENPITLSNTAGAGTWSSSNTSVATVSQSGTVFPVNAGITTITYTNPSYCPTSVSLNVTVKDCSGTGVNTVVAMGDSKLLQNAPNPFSGETTIGYNVATMINSAIITLYDLSGKELKRIAIKTKGKGSFVISGDTLPAGVYMYTLIIDGQKIDTKRITLMK